MFKLPKNLGMICLGAFLILTGLGMLANFSFAYMKEVVGALAIAAGVLLILGK